MNDTLGKLLNMQSNTIYIHIYICLLFKVSEITRIN